MTTVPEVGPEQTSTTPPALPETLVRALGVDYIHVVPAEGGDLYVTQFGRPLLEQLLPSNWYADKHYAKQGERLPGSTGHVYHVLSKSVNGRQADLVVKFSRVAQEVPLVVESSFPEDVPPETIAAARFNSPMEEFGLLLELRRGAFGPQQTRLLTQRPLAIYTPPEEFHLWQLGRNKSWFSTHRRVLADDQQDVAKAIELDIRRIYVLLYGWIKGIDAEQAWEAGMISEAELRSLTIRVIRELREKGFRVLDNKPKHFILRPDSSGTRVVRRHDGSLNYALVDFEFLQRTPEYQRQFKTAQRERYRQLVMPMRQKAALPTGSHHARCEIFGIDYLVGRVQDGGRLWVVGDDSELFDYFLPDRWRRTPRVKLSALNEIYRTRTRDNIYLVYRRSRVGSAPRVDPLAADGKRIREHGYNSPFEEVVIAHRLRQLGIPTTIPRAIYRTAHASTKAVFLRDPRRFAEHEDLLQSDDSSDPALHPDYDYYTLWDYMRGLAPVPTWGSEHMLDLEHACERGLVSSKDCESIIERTCRTLRNHGFEDTRIERHEFAVYLNDAGEIHRTPGGEIDASLGIDALTAHEIGLLDEEHYRGVLERLNRRLHAVDCEKLDVKGSHLLLSMDPDGRFRMDTDNEPRYALCNFEFVRGLYRPIR